MAIEQGFESGRDDGLPLTETRYSAEAIQPEKPSAPGLSLEYCPNCSEKLYGLSCKLLCPRCGYFLSCSDYY